MSFKTDNLVDVLPDAFGAADTEALIYRFLDVVGAELMGADDAVKRLLKSHWVDYAEGKALDSLGAIYAVARRNLPSGDPESDAAFRSRLRSIVPLYTGGGSRQAIIGAVQSALGLPFDLDTLDVPPAVRADLRKLVVLDEFPLTDEQVEFGPTRGVVEVVPGVGEEGVINVDIAARATAQAEVRLEWRIVSGGALDLSLERLGASPRQGVRSDGALFLQEGAVVRMRMVNGALSATLADGADISGHFTGLGGGAATLPVVPAGPSRWRFAARGARFGTTRFDLPVVPVRADQSLGSLRFDDGQFAGDDGEPFDVPRFAIAMSWLRRQPLVIDVTAPWSAKAAVSSVLARNNYKGQILAFESLGPGAVSRVVEQTRAAGVRANLHFSIRAAERHDARDELRRTLRAEPEDAAAADSLRMAATGRLADSHDARDSLGLAGEFGVATFDGPFGFT